MDFQQCALADSLYGLELAPQPVREKHLKKFARLFEQFCLGRASQESVTQSLVSSGRFRPSNDYDGVYEEYYEGLSYAVTPDTDSCTVDVLLEYKKGRLLLSLEDVQKNIVRSSNYRLLKSENKTEEGPNSEQVMTVEVHYYPKKSETNAIVLTYPMSDQNVFYMTLDYHYE